MQNSELVGVDLSRVDPEQNMARFYGIAMRPTLFGEVSVVRCWGRTMSVT
ncbi:MAG: WGR domain-containing protein [Pseudomonadota bacterium]